MSDCRFVVFQSGWCRLLSFLLLFVTVLCIVAVVDLKNASVKEFQAQSLTVDVTKPSPLVTLEFGFEYGSRLSQVSPQTLRCALVEEMGGNGSEAANIIADFQNQHDGTFQLEATCPEADVDALAKFLWDQLASYFTKDSPAPSGGDLMDYITCNLEFGIHFLGFVPLQHTHSLSKDQMDAIASLIEEKVDAQEDGEMVGIVSTESSNGGQTQEDKSPFELQVGFQTLQIGYRIRLPKFLLELIPEIQVVTPEIQVEFDPPNLVSPIGEIGFFRESSAILTVSGMNATFGSRDDEEQESDEVLIKATLTCLDDYNGCPWFGPLFGWSGRALDREDINIGATIDAGGSFLESLLGWHHFLSLYYSPKPDTDELILERDRVLSGTFDSRMEESAMDCLGISDPSGIFDFALCWHLQFSEGCIITGHAFLFDLEVAGLIDTSWDTSIEDNFQGNTTILMEFGEAKDILDATGSLFLDWSDESAIEFQLASTNIGDWYAYEADVRATGVLDGDTLSFAAETFKFLLENELLFDADGSFLLDWDSLTLNSSLVDLANNMDCHIEGSAPQTTKLLEGSSICSYDGDDFWNFRMDLEEYYSYSWGTAFESREWKGAVTESTSGFLASTILRVEYDSLFSYDAESSISGSDFKLFLDELIWRLREGEENLVDIKGEALFESVSEDKFSLGTGWNNTYSGSLRTKMDDNGSLIGISTSASTNWTGMRREDEDFNLIENTFELILNEILFTMDDISEANINGRVYFDTLASEYEASFEDTTILDFVTTIMGRWEIDDLLDLFSMFFDQIFFQLDGEVRADMSGSFQLAYEDNGSFEMLVTDDSGTQPATVEVNTRWTVADRLFNLFADRLFLEYDLEVLIDAEGEILFTLAIDDDDPPTSVMVTKATDEGGSFNVLLIDASPRASNIDVKSRWFVGDDYLNLFADKLFLEFEQNILMDASGEMNYVVDSNLGFSAKDEGKLDFSSTIAMSWQMYDSGEQEIPGFFRIANATFESGSEVFVDSRLLLEWYEMTNGDFVIEIGLNSSDSADLNIGMECLMELVDDDETLRTTMNSVHLAWKGDVYVAAGDTPLAIPVVPPTDAPVATQTPSGPLATQAPSGPPGGTDTPVATPTEPGSGASSTEDTASFTGITLQLGGITEELSDESVRAFETSLEDYYESFFLSESRRGRILQNALKADFFETTVTVTGQAVNGEGVLITYDQTVKFTKTEEALDPMELVVQPLSTVDAREQYVTQHLQQSEDESLSLVSSVGAPDMPGEDNSGSGSASSNQSIWQTNFLISITVIFFIFSI
mmetsp:Transcript_9011/g.15784  ORF Transcript_9011/g.15784 Transcript_9011/m.15784 type:complete len:1301 (+) Transcript_9011:125-4027(+)